MFKLNRVPDFKHTNEGVDLHKKFFFDEKKKCLLYF